MFFRRVVSSFTIFFLFVTIVLQSFPCYSKIQTWKHIPFPVGNRLICSIDQDGNTFYYHYDIRGNVNVITNQDGEVVQRIEYTPYGRVAYMEIKGAKGLMRRFSGKEFDQGVDLYYYGARYYDPEIGRWITPDPTVAHPYDPQDLNRYAYCRNNPITLDDPTGLSWKKFWKKTWETIQEPLIAAVVAAAIVFTWGAVAPQIAGLGLLFSKAGATIVASSAATTGVLEGTGEGRQFTRMLGNEVFDDILGMKPNMAAMFGKITAYMGVNTAFQFGFARLFGANKAITGMRNIQTPQDAQLAKDVLKEGGSFNYGTRPDINPTTGKLESASKLFFSGNEAIGVGAEALTIGGNPQHLGIVMKSLQVNSDMGALLGKSLGESVRSIGQGYLSIGISHTAVNVSLLNAGYSTTINSLLNGGWSTIPSTCVYGPYGGGLTGAITYEKNTTDN